MIVKVKSILLYIYYRTINSYYEEDLKFHKNVGGDVNYAKGETLVWLSFNAHIYFLVCVILAIFKIDITLPGNFIVCFIFMFFPTECFFKETKQKIRAGLRKWRKENKSDPNWKIKGWLVTFFFIFEIIEYFLEFAIHFYWFQ